MCVLNSDKPELRSEVDIIVADVGEPDSLAAMCKQAVIVLNCVGPVSHPQKHLTHTILALIKSTFSSINGITVLTSV